MSAGMSAQPLTAGAAMAPQFIEPAVVTFPMDGHDVTITAANVAVLGRLLRLLTPVLADLVNLDPDLMRRATSPQGADAQDVLEVLQIISQREGLLAQFVATAMGWVPGQPHAWAPAQVERLLPDRVLYMAAVVLQVNADFFGRARPVLQAAAELCRAVLPESSSTPGPASAAS